MTRKLLLTTALAALIITCTVHAEATIKWWQFWTDAAIRPTIEQMVADFEKQNPDIKVELTDLTWANGHEKIVIALSSGTGPDVLELGSDWIAQFAESSHLAVMSDDIAEDSADYQGWGMATYKGDVYARPWILGTRVLFANRSLLNKAGFEPDYIPIKEQELYQAAMKVDSLGKDIYGWGSNSAEKHRLYKKFMPFFWSAGAQVLTDDGTRCVLASQEGVEALEFYKQLHDSCGYVANQRGIEDAFLNGKIGFIISGDWLLKRIENEKRNIDFVTTLIPGPEFLGKSFMGGEFLAINAASDHKAAASKFIRFITSPENQLKFCKANRSANPSSRVAQQDDYFQKNPNLKAFVSQMARAVHPPVHPDWVYMEQYIEDAVEACLFEGVGPAEALYQARKKIDKLLNEE